LTGFKIPVSALVVIHTPALEVLLLERADHPGFWQSVTGSQHEGETLRETAIREVGEEPASTPPATGSRNGTYATSTKSIRYGGIGTHPG
jgi:dATP pyrophosphohydrolase